MAVEEVDLVVLSFGSFVCIFGIFSYLVRDRLYLNEAPFAFLVGFVLGPYGVGQLTSWDGSGEDRETADKLALGLSRVVLGIQLVLVGVQLPRRYLRHEVKSLCSMLLPVMTLMWIVTATLIYLIIPDTPYLVALVVAACATPTDPVLSKSIVDGAFADQYVPSRIRNLISAEAGLNDGLAYPFLFLAIRLLKLPSSGQAIKEWILEDVLYTVGGGVVLGVIVGFAASSALRFGCKHEIMDKEAFLLYAPMIGLGTIGLAGALDCDDLLAAFVAGSSFNTFCDDWYRKETEEDEVQNVLDFLMNAMFFAFAGAAIPWYTFNDPSLGTEAWRLVLLAVAVLLLRRLPATVALYKIIPAFKDSAEAAFVGYFGPIGCGAIYIMSLTLEEFPLDLEGTGTTEERVRQLVKPITYALVISSLLGHTLMLPVVKVAFKWTRVDSIRLKDTEAGSEADESEREEEEYEEGVAPPPEEGGQQTESGGSKPVPIHPGDRDGQGSSERDLESSMPPSSVHHPTRGSKHRGPASSRHHSTHPSNRQHDTSRSERH